MLLLAFSLNIVLLLLLNNYDVRPFNPQLLLTIETTTLVVSLECGVRRQMLGRGPAGFYGRPWKSGSSTVGHRGLGAERGFGWDIPDAKSGGR